MKVVIIGDIKCPYCGYGNDFTVVKTWKMRTLNVRMFICPRCGGKINHYSGVTSKGKQVEFILRLTSRARKVKTKNSV
jgi:DNA-directed RNA polymerase subunit RPC12/RpoP